MTASQKPLQRCAIYTRKSSEEGLEQSFNSLDAQREACEAFILSQREEGWKDLLASFVRRVIIQENKIDILLSRADLRQVLQKGDRFVPTPLDRPLKSVDAEDLICLAIEAKLKRSGGDSHRAGRRSSSRLRQRADGARTAKQQVPTHPLVRAHAGL